MGKRAKKQAPQTSKFIVFNMYAYDVCTSHLLTNYHHFLSLYDVCMLSTIRYINITEKKQQLARRFKCPFCANGALVVFFLCMFDIAVVIANHLLLQKNCGGILISFIIDFIPHISFYLLDLQQINT